MILNSLKQIFQKTNRDLITAAKNGQIEVVRVLIDYQGADVHTRHELALRRAAQNGHTETVQLLLDRGADVHAWNDGALRLATQNGYPETVRVLQEAAARTAKPHPPTPV